MRVMASEKHFHPLIRPLAQCLKKTLEKVHHREGVMYVYLVGDKVMRNNVLAYPMPRRFPRPDERRAVLGEVYLNPNRIARKSERLAYMAIHGALHLLGYAHEQKKDILKMERLERKLVRLCNNTLSV